MCDDGNRDNSDDCVDNCQIATCGDGYVRKVVTDPANDEACDDGSRNVTSNGYDLFARCIADPAKPADACKKTAPYCGDGNCTDDDLLAECRLDCKGSICGNGFREPGEFEDCAADEPNCNGPGAMGNTVSVACQRPVCGDGYLNEQAGEDCDDGNFENNDGCVRDCRLAICGDGLIQEGVEQCDDPAQPERCDSESCVVIRRVFITSGSFNGSQIGGLSGADAKCNAEAEAAALPGRFRAWLSDSTGSPSTRFDTSFIGSYRLVNGTEIATGWEGLTGGTLLAPINIDIQGKINEAAVWTNTLPNGTPDPKNLHCSNWTSNGGTSTLGDSSATNGQWTAAASGQGCLGGAGLYCFEDR
jgi:cysteine-rich repeat protein